MKFSCVFKANVVVKNLSLKILNIVLIFRYIWFNSSKFCLLDQKNPISLMTQHKLDDFEVNQVALKLHVGIFGIMTDSLTLHPNLSF